MSPAPIFPFDPELVEQLAARSRGQTGSAPIAPIAAPLVIDDRGYVWSPAPNNTGEMIGSFVHGGFRLGWTPIPELNGLLLIQWGGQASDPRFEDDGLTTFFTHDGLRRLIIGLQSIDAQLTGAKA